MESASRDASPGSRYKILSKIGSGSFGSVFKALDTKSGRYAAIKVIELEGTDDEVEDIQSEVLIMSQLSSPYLVKFYASYVIGHDLWIIMEYCPGGACSDLLSNGGLPERYVAIIAREVLKGLEYLHREGKLHRDVKAANILLGSDGSVKLGDFGVSSQLTTSMATRNTFVGTPFWMAPEVIKRSGYNTSADIWSFGITVIELAEGAPPHSNLLPMRALFVIPKYKPPELSSKFSKGLRDLVAQCLCKEPNERASCKTLLNHKIVKSAKKNSALIELLSSRKEARTENAQETLLVDAKALEKLPARKENDVAWNFETIKVSAPSQKVPVCAMLKAPEPLSPQRSLAESETLKVFIEAMKKTCRTSASKLDTYIDKMAALLGVCEQAVPGFLLTALELTSRKIGKMESDTGREDHLGKYPLQALHKNKLHAHEPPLVELETGFRGGS